MRIINPLTYLRSLRRYGGFSLLNIAGLALGISSVLFVSIWILDELSYDRFHTHADNIYRVESLLDFSGDPFVWSVAPAPFADAVLKDYPEVEASVIMQKAYHPVLKVNDELFYESNLYYSTSSIFDIFSFNLKSGNTDLVLSDPYSIVLSEKMAERFFGDEDPLGKTILLDNKDLLTISGVLENIPSNSHLQIDYLVPFSILNERGHNLDGWNKFDYITYILLNDNVDAEQFNQKLKWYLKTKDKESGVVSFINPLTRIHLYRDPGFASMDYPISEKGPISKVILFGVIGLVILMIACINFINLATAFASQRAKEIGVRKVAGAGKGTLMKQLFGESFFQSLTALFIALVLLVFLLPLFNGLSGKDFSATMLFNWENIIVSLVIVLFTALVAGVYPALVLSSFKPVAVLKSGHDTGSQGSWLRKILVTVQFILSITFIFCILVMKQQIKYMQNQYLGFDREQVMVIYPRNKIEKTDVLAEQIARLSGVKGVALGGNVPVNMGNFSTLSKWDGNISGKKLRFHMMQTDDRYIDLLGMEIVSGRNFFKGTITDDVIVNESAIRMMEIDNPLGKHIWNGETEYTIIGVVRDFHYRPMSEEINPVFIYKNSEWWSKRLFVRLEPGNHFEIVDNICALVKENAPDYPVRYIFLDEQIDQYYDDERRLSSLINAATILTILISCMGLFGLSAFTVRKKRKEIGVRKVHGASSIGLVLSLSKEFAILLIMAALPAFPLAYYIIKKWLLSYAYRIDIHPVYFILTLFIVMTIALFTVGIQTIRASNMNPAESLREE